MLHLRALPVRARDVLVAAAALPALALTGCGDSSDASQTASYEVHTEARDMLPDAVREAGTLEIGITTGFPPYTFYKPGTQELTGYEPELGRAIAQSLGLEPVFKVGTFDSLIPGLQADRFDIAMSGFTDTPERQEVVDFVDYLKGVTGLIVRAEDANEISAMEDLCGKDVAVAKGTMGQTVIEEVSAGCVERGEPAVATKTYADTSATLLAVKSGRAFAEPAELGKAIYQVNQMKDEMAVIDTGYNPSNIGLVVPKDQEELRNAILAVVDKLYADGVFTDDILGEWDLSDLALEEPGVNLGAEGPKQ